MREKRLATWDGGNITWGGRVGVLGTVPACVCAQEMAGVRDGFLAGKGVKTCLMHLAIMTQNDSFKFVHELKQEMHADLNELMKLIEKGKGKSVNTKFDRPSVVRQPNAQRNPKPSVLGANHKPTVSRPHLKSNQSRDKVLPDNSQVKVKKTQVEVPPRIPSVSNKMKYVTACKHCLNSRTLNANVVCTTCNKCLVDSNHFGCV
nr:hypothetical protein [Tanacetum cinerariifolium]